MYEYLQIGKIVSTHGIKGELKVIPLTDDPRRFDMLKYVYVETSEKKEKYAIESVKYKKGAVILKLSSFDSPEAAMALIGFFLLIDRENAVKLPEGSFFICDLLESDVFNEKGISLGRLVDIIQTGSNDVYVIRNHLGKDLLLPALKSVVQRVSTKEKRIDVIVPKGLLDDEV